ncbi:MULTISPECIES: c-type cytochrome [unclassified Roseovarius]|uniref:c-type cytochrome n=1 Tax=unclassified Roseovarius TaxID=2614913 RepID=UPI00273FD37C|nr:cytochrome c [Roseovarius sp. MMSF_3350]
MRHATLTALSLCISVVATSVLAQQGSEPKTPQIKKPGAGTLGATTESFVGTDGATLYRRACSGCHGPEGGGVMGAAAYPALAGNPRLASARYPVNLVIEGNGAMPSFAEWLDDEQVAAVVNYLRSNLGNEYDGQLTAEDVAQMRADFADLDGG